MGGRVVTAATDTAVYEIADTLRACYSEALGGQEVCLRPGPVVDLWASTTDDECCTGAAWVQVVSIYPGFPEQAVDPRGCWPADWSVVLMLGRARCAPTPDANHIPTCDQHTTLLRGLLDDWTAMACAVACLSRVDPDPKRYVIGEWSQRPIEGRCAGSVLPVTVGFQPCLTCPS